MKKKYGIVLSVILVMALAVFSTFAIAGCGGGGTEATGDILYEASTDSEEVVQDWAGAIFSGTETGITLTYVDANDGVTATLDTITVVGAVALSGSQTITHGLGATPTSVNVTGWGTGTSTFEVSAVGATTFKITQTGGSAGTASWAASY